MSNYITEINGKKYFAIDDYFSPRVYGYIEKTEGETWETFSRTNKKVYRYDELLKTNK